jgi:hypothetical protein
MNFKQSSLVSVFPAACVFLSEDIAIHMRKLVVRDVGNDVKLCRASSSHSWRVLKCRVRCTFVVDPG